MTNQDDDINVTAEYTSSESTSKTDSTAGAQSTASKPKYDFGTMVKEGLSFLATTAGQAVEVVQEVSDKLTSGATIRMEQAVGRDAEVSATIPANGTGEVLFSLGGSMQHCPARGRDGTKDFAKGSKVKIVDVTNQLIFVE